MDPYVYYQMYLDLTCRFIDLQKYLYKRWIVKQMKKSMLSYI
jgi:hypothetical protein